MQLRIEKYCEQATVFVAFTDNGRCSLIGLLYIVFAVYYV